MQAYQTLAGCQTSGSAFGLQGAGGFYGQASSPYTSHPYAGLSECES